MGGGDVGEEDVLRSMASRESPEDGFKIFNTLNDWFYFMEIFTFRPGEKKLLKVV